MEDCNMLAADCAVISCCCQCLILQVLMFVLLRLPCKLIQKTKQYAKKKLRRRKKEMEMGRYEDEFVGIQVEGFSLEHEDHGCGRCMEEVERVLEEFSQKGEFAFGSFWGRVESGRLSTCVDEQQEFDYSVLQYRLIEMVGSLSCS